MKHDMFIAVLSFLVGMIVAFYASIFVVGLDCQPGKETVNLSGINDSRIELEMSK